MYGPMLRQLRAAAIVLAFILSLSTLTVLFSLQRSSKRVHYGVWAQSVVDHALAGAAAASNSIPTASGYRSRLQGIPRQWPSFDYGFWAFYYPSAASMVPKAAVPALNSTVYPASHRIRITDGVDERLVPLDFRVNQLHMWPSAKPSKTANPDWSLERSRTWAIVCRQFDLSHLPPVHIVEFEPILTDPWAAAVATDVKRSTRRISRVGNMDDDDNTHPQQDTDDDDTKEQDEESQEQAMSAEDIASARSAAGPNADAVHHISAMLCPHRKPKYAFGQVFDCDEDGPDESCDEILVIYDRGAKTFRLPETVGSRIGQGMDSHGTVSDDGSPLGVLILEVHYLPALLPNASVPPNGFLDSSGLRLWVTPDYRAHDGKFFGLSDETMQLQPGENQEDVEFTCPPATLQHQLGPSMVRAGGGVGVFAYHLHAHGLATALQLDVIRANEGALDETKDAGEDDQDEGGDAYGDAYDQEPSLRPGDEGGDAYGDAYDQDPSLRPGDDQDPSLRPGDVQGLSGWIEVLGRLNPFGGYTNDQSLHYPGLRGTDSAGTGGNGHLEPIVPESATQLNCEQKPIEHNEASIGMDPVPSIHGSIGSSHCVSGIKGWVGVFGAEMEERQSSSPTAQAAGDTVIPVILHPGDTLRARCSYSTVNRTRTVHYGLGLLDEMCSPIVWVFPVDGTRMLPNHPDDALQGGSVLRNDCVLSEEHIRLQQQHGRGGHRPAN